MRTVSDEERRARLGRRHALAAEERAASVEAAVEAMTCLHATEPASVYLAAFARSGASRARIDRALQGERSVVRQLAMRRTVFAFGRELLPAVLGSASARVARQLAARLAKEVEAAGHARDGAAWLDDTRAAVLAHLEQRPSTTAELRAALPALDARLLLSPGKQYETEVAIASRMLGVIAADGSVVRGANQGNWKLSRPAWTLSEQWLGEQFEPPCERDGYATLVARWLWSFGPGTEADLVWWLGATKAAVRHALADVEAEEVRLEDGAPAWLHPEDTDEVAAPTPWAALLPALDPTTMGWKQRAFYLDGHDAALFDRNGNAGPSAWWEGRMVGGWRQEEDGTVVVVPAGRLPRGARGPLEERARELTDWLGGDVVRSIYQSPLVRSLS